MNFVVILPLLCVAATARPKQYVDPKIYEVFAYQDFNKDGFITLDEAYELGLRCKPVSFAWNLSLYYSRKIG